MTRVVTRRTARIGIVAILALLLVAVSGYAALPFLVRRVLVWQIGTQTGRVATVEAVDVALLRGRFALRKLHVADRDGGTLASIDRLDVRFRPLDLFRGRLHILDGTLAAPAVRIVRTGPRTFNVTDLLEPGGGGRSRLGVTVDRFVVADGAVTIMDATETPPRVWRVDALTMDVRAASTLTTGPPGTVTMSARVAGSPLEVALRDVRLAPITMRGTVTARDVDVGLAALALPPGGPLDVPRGSLSLTASVDHDATAGSRVGVDARLDRVELRRPGQPRAVVSAPTITVVVDELKARPGVLSIKRLAVDGGSITLEDERFGSVKRWQVDGVAFEARDVSSARDAAPGVATARAAHAGAQLSVWAGEVRLAPIETRATVVVRNVDLALVRLALPPDLPVQPERGVIDATVRVEHDGTRGTRLALDAGLSGIELRRPAHFVTAPAVRITAEDIALAAGTVTVGTARLASERLMLEERARAPVRTWDVRNLIVDAKSLSSRRDVVQGVATLQAAVAGASVSAWVTNARLDPLELHATTVLRNVDLALAQLYLPPQAPIDAIRGSVNATIDVDHSVAAGTRVNADAILTSVDARGRDRFAGVSLSAPSMRATIADARRRGDAVSVGRVEVAGSGTLADARETGSRVDLVAVRAATEGLTWPVVSPARVELSARFRDRGELDAAGTARLTAPMPTIAWQADLGLKFRGVDLTPVGAYVPMARGLGGRVRANITATVAYAGALTARVRGDVGGGRFVLAEGGKTLLALRRVDLTGLDAQWPERVSVEQVRLREPFALVERDRGGMLPLLARFKTATPATESGAQAAVPGAPIALPGSPRPMPAVSIGELVVQSGRATVVDERPAVPARVELPRLDVTARDVTWPATRPARIVLDAALPGGGTLRAEGTVTEPLALDLTVTIKDGEMAAVQPFLGVRAHVRARVDANVAVAGPVVPAPKLAIRGEVGVRNFALGDGSRALVTMERLHVTGIDADWPARVTIDRVHAERSWAMIERDRNGAFPLRTLLERTSPPPSGANAPAVQAPAAFKTSVAVRELVFEQQAATIVDGITNPPARIDVAGARLAMREFAWPARGPVAVELTSPTPVAGKLALTGTVTLDPVRLEARATFDGVSIEPAQAYLPIGGRVAGRLTGAVGLVLTLEPVAVQVTGDARLQGFRLNDGERSLVAVGRLEAGGIDVDWPKTIAVRNVLLRRPRLLVERDAKGEIILRRVATPRWEAVPKPTANGAATAPPRVAAAPPTIEIATFTLERADGRFVDHTMTPPYAEELSNVQLVVTNFTTASGGRMQFTGSGGLGGGSFKLTGEGVQGTRTVLDLKVDLRDIVVPRANAYLEHFTAWTATRGSLSGTATYHVAGTHIDATHDVVVRDLDVTRPADRDEVEERVGLPLGMLVSLLKDSRGEIKVSLPVSGDIGTREFDFGDAVWMAVRNVSLRLLAAPFSRVGSLFVTSDSKVESVAIAPVVFEAGAARLGTGMDVHLEKIAGLLRSKPAIAFTLSPIFTQADVDASKRAALPPSVPPPGQAGQAAPAADPSQRADPPRDGQPPERPMSEAPAAERAQREALRALGTQRLDVVRQALMRGGGIDASRLPGTVPRSPLIESAGSSRVELKLQPATASQ